MGPDVFTLAASHVPFSYARRVVDCSPMVYTRPLHCVLAFGLAAASILIGAPAAPGQSPMTFERDMPAPSLHKPSRRTAVRAIILAAEGR